MLARGKLWSTRAPLRKRTIFPRSRRSWIRCRVRSGDSLRAPTTTRRRTRRHATQSEHADRGYPAHYGPCAVAKPARSRSVINISKQSPHAGGWIGRRLPVIAGDAGPNNDGPPQSVTRAAREVRHTGAPRTFWRTACLPPAVSTGSSRPAPGDFTKCLLRFLFVVSYKNPCKPFPAGYHRFSAPDSTSEKVSISKYSRNDDNRTTLTHG